MIDFTIKPESNPTVEEAVEHKEFIDDINYLIAEGFIDVEQGTDGEVRAFPTT